MRVVTTNGDGIANEEYLNAILDAIDNTVAVKNTATFGDASCAVSLHRFLDPMVYVNRWAVVLDAEVYEVRDYATQGEAESAYAVLKEATGPDGVMWSIYA